VLRFLLDLDILGVDTATPRTVKTDLVFLTRVGCVKTLDMAHNLDNALVALKLPADYGSIDIGTLGRTDPHTGYPTPTVLWADRDIFGMPVPAPPYAAPT
jgi:hypothetical protein